MRSCERHSAEIATARALANHAAPQIHAGVSARLIILNSATWNECSRAVGFFEAGNGVPVVLLHSGGSSSAQWKEYERLLGDRYRIIAPDLFGSGSDSGIAWAGRPHAQRSSEPRRRLDGLSWRRYSSCSRSLLWWRDRIAFRFANARARTNTAVIEPQVVTLLPQAGEHILWQEYRIPACTFNFLRPM